MASGYNLAWSVARMILSKRAEERWATHYPNVSIHDEFNRRFVPNNITIRPDGDGLVRRQTPCGAVLVIARGHYIIDVYPVTK